MGAIDARGRATVIFLASLSSAIFALGCVLVVFFTMRVSSEVKLKAELDAAKRRAEAHSQASILLMSFFSVEPVGCVQRGLLPDTAIRLCVQVTNSMMERDSFPVGVMGMHRLGRRLDGFIPVAVQVFSPGPCSKRKCTIDERTE